LREALALGHDFIGTEHLLLGLLREGEGLAARMLVDQGIDLDSARAGVLAEVGGGPGAAPRRPGGVRGGPGRGRRGIRHRRPRRAL
jgi:ATP-dependent Clp protease ATP-binding subunit ClpC